MACAELDAAAGIVSSQATTPLSVGAAPAAAAVQKTTSIVRGPAQDTQVKHDREPSASAEPSRPTSSIDVSLPPMEGLSDEERAHIEAVMAMAERDQAASVPPPPEPQPPRTRCEKILSSFYHS
ncbi:unnamed protein product [Cylicostephanus goldi]|uniref:Uncharacterized protein n=1 Tax=Cylicostephanus goldi TaxID=71465 RepID=A0A3P7NVW4_CYLGO|nr:unnamed protein product [Cylicostephanus goldi]